MERPANQPNGGMSGDKSTNSQMVSDSETIGAASSSAWNRGHLVSLSAKHHFAVGSRPARQKGEVGVLRPCAAELHADKLLDASIFTF